MWSWAETFLEVTTGALLAASMEARDPALQPPEAQADRGVTTPLPTPPHLLPSVTSRGLQAPNRRSRAFTLMKLGLPGGPGGQGAGLGRGLPGLPHFWDLGIKQVRQRHTPSSQTQTGSWRRTPPPPNWN